MRTTVLMAVIVGLAAAAGIWVVVETRHNRLVWDHFDVVKHGYLYRSGQLNPTQLRTAIKRYGIRTLISFQITGQGVARERIIARENGVDFMNLPMPGDGFGKEEQFRQVLAAIDDPERRPVLIHCARGTCRTGAAVALYRYERDGWTVEDVADEMRRQSYREGWLPGYIYHMVKSRPMPERFEPRFLHDRNLPPSLRSLMEGMNADREPKSGREVAVDAEATHVH
jgi:protein tyrosine phosphatase (PTP) superfamily phosphohydrolase (DUF442 family)